jgi:type IV secretion system protein VirD4
MNPFSRKASAQPPPPEDQSCDDILGDLPRGEEGRRRHDSHLPRTYFEPPEKLAALGFKDKSADNFIGIVNGVTDRIMREDGRAEYRTRGGVPVGVRDDRSMTTQAGSRAGKGRSVIIPDLLTYGGSMVVVDVKGENAMATARFRAQVLGQKVYVIDPFRICAEVCVPYLARFNPLRAVSEDSVTIVEDAGSVADACIVPSGGDAHWDETAKAWAEAVSLHVVTSDLFKPEEKTLVTVGDLIAGRRLEWNQLLIDMLANDALDNFIAGAARAMKEKPERELGSILSNVRKNLKFLQYDSIRDVLSGHDFNLEDLKRGAITIYLVLPATRMATCSQLIRLFINQTLAAFERVRTKPKIPAMLVIDEFPVLGRMQELENAIGQIAGLGLRIHTIVQDLGQIKALYKDRWESFMGNSGVLRFFGVADEFSANWISNYLGKTTINVTDVGSTTAEQKNTQGASGFQERQQVVELLSAAEIRRIFARDDHFNRQLVMIPGRRPYILQRANYDQHELFAGRFDSGA